MELKTRKESHEPLRKALFIWNPDPATIPTKGLRSRSKATKGTGGSLGRGQAGTWGSAVLCLKLVFESKLRNFPILRLFHFKLFASLMPLYLVCRNGDI